MKTFVFSYNRSQFLINCISSIQQCAPTHSVTIIDDGSDDPPTQKALQRLSERYEVIQNTRGFECENKTGGLAGSMNLAMAIAASEKRQYVLFIQDDMQFVRKLSPRDVSMIDDYFLRVQNSIQLSTSFIRTLSADSFFNGYIVLSEAHAYIRRPEAERGKSNFSDTGVFSVPRFFEVFKSFDVGEDKNSSKAKNLGLTCGRSGFPFMCWLPYPISYRGKRRRLRHRAFEVFGRSGFYPIEIMAEHEAARFVQRDLEELPIMERFLVARNVPRRDIWSTGGGEYNFLAYGGVAANVYQFLKRTKRRLQKGASRLPG